MIRQKYNPFTDNDDGLFIVNNNNSNNNNNNNNTSNVKYNEINQSEEEESIIPHSHHKKRISLVLRVLLLMGIITSYYYSITQSMHNVITLPTSSLPRKEQGRKIRTFYHDTNQNQHEQLQQIELWKQGWTDHGWDARVLTMADAERHPLYQELNARIQKLGMCTNPVFQRLCFVRWLAYAADGGGWMSDYDVLPMDFYPAATTAASATTSNDTTTAATPTRLDNTPSYLLPNEGKFTSHDLSLASLTSGSSDEITRIITLMISKVEEHAALKTRGTQCTDGSWQITDQEILVILKRDDVVLMKEEGGVNNPLDPWFISPPGGTGGLVIHAHDFLDKLQVSSTEGSGVVAGGNTDLDCSQEYSAIHFSGKPSLKRDQRLNYMVDTYQVWKDRCSHEHSDQQPQ